MAVDSAIRVDRETFERDGYIVIENVFDPAADLDPVVQEYATQLDELATLWHAERLIDSAYADLPFAERFRPPLTTVRIPEYEIGRRSAQLLLAHIEEPDHPPETVLVAPHLVIRGSTALAGTAGRAS